MDARAFVGAVLAPHHAEDAQLGITGLAAQDLADRRVFGFGELVLGNEVWGDGHAATATRRSEWKTTRPSVECMSGSVARSGWGIMPITLRCSLSTPAIARIEPFAFST